MMRRLWVSAMLGVAAPGAIAGCQGHGSEATVKVDTAKRPVPVTVVPLVHRSVLRTVNIVGKLEAWEDVTIGARRDGRIVRVFHDMGDRVKPGDLLVQMETEDADLEILQAERKLQAELARLGLKELPRGEFDFTSLPAVVQARLALDRARQNLARERSLIQRNAGTMQDFQNAENDERSAEASMANALLTAQATLAGAHSTRVAIDVARYKRSEMEIRAPNPSTLPDGIDGPITYAILKKQVSEGQMLRQGDPVVELVIDRPLRFMAPVPAYHSVDVKVNQPVDLTVSSHPGTTFEGKVARINPKVDALTHTMGVEALMPNHRGLLRPGGYAKASIVIDQDAEATTVPIESVSKFAGVVKVFIVEGDKARAIPVKEGLQGEGWVEVVGDLPREALVVTTGLTKLDRLAEGTAVAIREPKGVDAGKSEGEPSRHAGGARPVAQAEELSPR